MITGHGEKELVVQALRGGACDFIPKPIDRDYFVASLRRAMQARGRAGGLRKSSSPWSATSASWRRSSRSARNGCEQERRWRQPAGLDGGRQRQMQKIVEQIKQVADSPLTVLVEGETGTGKELVGPGDPPAERPTRAAVCCRRLRRDTGHADRVRALRV